MFSKLYRLPDGVARWPSSTHGSSRDQNDLRAGARAPLLRKHHKCFAHSPPPCRNSNIKTQRVAFLATHRRTNWQFAVNPRPPAVPTQCPLSAHSVPTQLPLSSHTVPIGNSWDARIQELNPIEYVLTLFHLSNIPRICSGNCVGTEWPLSGH